MTKGLSKPLLTYLLTYITGILYEILQICLKVVHDGEKHRPVVGGYTSGAATVKGYFEQQFNLAGDYKFTM